MAPAEVDGLPPDTHQANATRSLSPRTRKRAADPALREQEADEREQEADEREGLLQDAARLRQHAEDLRIRGLKARAQAEQAIDQAETLLDANQDRVRRAEATLARAQARAARLRANVTRSVRAGEPPPGPPQRDVTDLARGVAAMRRKTAAAAAHLVETEQLVARIHEELAARDPGNPEHKRQANAAREAMRRARETERKYSDS